MSLTITEANHVNTVLNWITRTPGTAGPVTEENARLAAAELADKAFKTLMAGLDHDRLLAAWPIRTGKCSLCLHPVPVPDLAVHLRDAHPGVLVDETPTPVLACSIHTLIDADGAPVAAPALGCDGCHAAMRAGR